MASKFKPIKGTVAMATEIRKDGTRVTVVDCEKVLKRYCDYGKTPKTWGEARAAELAFVCLMLADLVKQYAKLKKRVKALQSEVNRHRTDKRDHDRLVREGPGCPLRGV